MLSIVAYQLSSERKHLIGITEQTEIGQGKDGSGAIRVDGNDGLRLAHSTGMLSRAGDAAGDVEAWVDRPARGANLPRVFHPAAISCYAGRAYCRAKQPREGCYLREALATHAATARYNALGGLQFNILRRGSLDSYMPDAPALYRIINGRRDHLYFLIDTSYSPRITTNGIASHTGDERSERGAAMQRGAHLDVGAAIVHGAQCDKRIILYIDAQAARRVGQAQARGQPCHAIAPVSRCAARYQ